MDDPINHPSHYTSYNMEVITLTRTLSFSCGNFFKYVLRAKHKGCYHEDLKKALWYAKDVFSHREWAIGRFKSEILDYFLGCFPEALSEEDEIIQLLYMKLGYCLYLYNRCPWLFDVRRQGLEFIKVIEARNEA
jgi:hypothetical protein